MTPSRYDVLVIGAGMAGLAAARKSARAGRATALVDARPYGGTCALRGCDPKKVLVGAAEAVELPRRLQEHGVAGEPRIDWPALQRFKRSFTEPVPARLEGGLDDLGVATLHGSARFTGPATLEIDGREVRADRILVASGARPRDLGIPGAEHAITSTAFLELERLPERIVFIGGGYVSFEFAHVAARAGAHATVLHRGARVLSGFDPDLVDDLMAASRVAGIAVCVNAPATRIERSAGGYRVHREGGAPVEADLVVHGAGRVPDLAGLELDAAGVDWDAARGIAVDEHLRSVSNPAVYAAGDAAASPGLPLTPVAVHEGLVAAANLLDGDRKTPDYTGTPSVVFTLPPLARAGLDERQAAERGLAVEVKHTDTSGWYTARRVRAPHAAAKVLLERRTGRVVGAHLLGPEAGETINLFALAIRHGLTARDLKTTLWVHPSAGGDVASLV